MGRTLIMSDVNWRDINEDHSLFYPNNEKLRIIAHTTNDLIWDCVANNVDRNYVLKDCQYTVVRYAYLE